MTDSRIDRAQILFQQKRYTEAEKLLMDLLSSDPGDILVLTLLAEINLLQDKFEKARAFLNSALAIRPDAHHLFYIKARIAIQQDKYDEAEKDINQAIEYNASDADYYALWSSIKLTRKKFEDALALADRALSLDAENILALNIRSTASLKLNNSDESFKSIENALREDPTNAYTHANFGWNLLEKRAYKKALEHFREALKNDPNFDYAKAGMVEALKAKNFIYRWFLKYSFWMSNLTEKYQWAVIIGFYFGFRALKSIAANNEQLQPYLVPLIVLLALVAFSTWVMTPLSNLFLRLNMYGKFLLSENEIRSSNFVGVSASIFLIGIILYVITGKEYFLPVAVFGFAMMVPLSVMFSPTKFKHSLAIYSIVMTLLGIGAIVNTFMTGELFNMLTVVFIFGFVAFQWLANFFIIKEANV